MSFFEFLVFFTNFFRGAKKATWGRRHLFGKTFDGGPEAWLHGMMKKTMMSCKQLSSRRLFLKTNGWNLKRPQLLVFGDLWALWWCCWCKVSMNLVTGCKTLRQLHYLNHQIASACVPKGFANSFSIGVGIHMPLQLCRSD